ncbi:MAG: hypothetical protein J7559_03135 [Cohnella sp.]|nr:hypothetical protein [Cohnella sp.]
MSFFVFLLWLVLSGIGLLVLYWIIRAAVNHSDIISPNAEVIALGRQLERQHKELMLQLESVKQTIRESNASK